MARSISTLELCQRILSMAESGVYRESILEALQPLATQKQIRAAITQARQYGLYSVAEWRDQELGTYYQRDLEAYQALQRALQAAVPLSETEPLEQLRRATIALRWSLGIAAGLGWTATLGGLGCLFLHQVQLSSGLLICGCSWALIWGIQRCLARGLI